MCARCRAGADDGGNAGRVVRTRGSMMFILSAAHARPLHNCSWLVWLNLHARLSAARDSRDERVLHVGAEKLWNIGKTSV